MLKKQNITKSAKEIVAKALNFNVREWKECTSRVRGGDVWWETNLLGFITSKS